jgi:hypothetical protein
MTNKYSLINKNFLNKWLSAMEQAGIPPIAYSPKVRLVTDEELGYSIGVIFNPNRFERLKPRAEEKVGCKLCGELEETLTNPFKDLAPQISDNFIITYNAFPHALGSSMALAKNKEGKEKPMYDTSHLSGLVSELEEVFNIASELGLKVFHNNFGAGATIPNHEHWHLINLVSFYDQLGGIYGFDAAEKTQSKAARGVSIMSQFPFAHLIFDGFNPELMVRFLGNIGEGIGKNYLNGHVPHSFCQGQEGVLIVPTKKHNDRCLGSSDVAGHYMGCKSQDEFERATFSEYVSRLDEILFRKEDIDLEMFL